MRRKEDRKMKIVANADSSMNKIFEKFKKIEKKPTEADIALIIRSLKSHFLFFDLSEHEL